MYFFAIFLPPVAAFVAGGVLSGLLNIVLTCCGIVPGIIHAVLLVNKRYADARHRELVAASRGR